MSEQARQRAGHEVLRFLDNHRLDHSPDNYAFAHAFLVGDDDVLKARVAQIIDGGVRITPAEVRRLAPPAEASGTLATIAPQLDQMTLRVLDIIGDAMNAAGGLNRDLVRASATLLTPDAPDLRSIIAAMIERTATTERSLAGATQQAQRLRQELASLRDETSRDRLTGLLNRAAMEEHLAAASRAGFCAAAIDIDHFKRVNDTHGHGVGDRVLRAVANVLAEECAPHLVARWEGGKFVVLLEGVDLKDGTALVEHARAALAAKRLRLRENDEPLDPISFSAGVAAARGRSSAAVLEAADALLRQAKSRGRNRIIGEGRLVDLGAGGKPDDS